MNAIEDSVIAQDIEVDHVDTWTYVACPYCPPCEECGRLTAHFDHMIVATDGACRGNGQADPKAAIGVHFHQGSPHNISTTLDGVHTNQQAELIAGIRALEVVQDLAVRKITSHSPTCVVIKSDSEYLVKGMTDWIGKWKSNSYVNAKGKSVVNAALFRRLDDLVGELESNGVAVEFWYVPRAQNAAADALANAALDKAERAIELVVERTGVSRMRARQALEMNGNYLVDAIESLSL